MKTPTYSFLTFLFFLFFFQLSSNSQTSKFADSDGTKIHYQIIGSGFPVLIINGGPGFSSEGFLPLAQEIASMGYQTILYDQRGTGKSPLTKMDSSTITMDLMNQDIEAIRKDLDIDQWIVLGHSFGGMMANYYASFYPEHIAGIIHSSSGGLDLSLIGTTRSAIESKLTSNQIDSLAYWRNAMNQENAPEEARLNYTTYLAHAYVYNKEFVPIIANRLTESNLELNGMVWRNMREIGFDCTEKLSHFKKPVLIIQGKNDILQKDLAIKANEVFTNSELLFLDSCGHYGWLDQKKKYYEAIENFLEINAKTDSEKVELVIEKYVRSIYENDSTLLTGIVDSSLQKSGHFWSRKQGEWFYEGMSFSDLAHTASTYNSKGWIPEWAPIAIEIYEVKEKVASAKVNAIWGFDYILLSKQEDGSWKMDKILWQSYSEEEAKDYLSELKNAFEQQKNNG